jgi:hypothetical protein
MLSTLSEVKDTLLFLIPGISMPEFFDFSIQRMANISIYENLLI